MLLFALYEVYGKAAIVDAHQNRPGTAAHPARGTQPAPPRPRVAPPVRPAAAARRRVRPALPAGPAASTGWSSRAWSWPTSSTRPATTPAPRCPGQIGNFSVAGHRIPSIFWNLQEMTKGQHIVVETRDDWYVYTRHPERDRHAALDRGGRPDAGPARRRADRGDDDADDVQPEVGRLPADGRPRRADRRRTPTNGRPARGAGELTMYAMDLAQAAVRPAGQDRRVCRVRSVGVVGLLWFGVFPTVDPHLPFNNVQVTTPDGAVPHRCGHPVAANAVGIAARRHPATAVRTRRASHAHPRRRQLRLVRLQPRAVPRPARCRVRSPPQRRDRGRRHRPDRAGRHPALPRPGHAGARRHLHGRDPRVRWRHCRSSAYASAIRHSEPRTARPSPARPSCCTARRHWCTTAARACSPGCRTRSPPRATTRSPWSSRRCRTRSR